MQIHKKLSKRNISSEKRVFYGKLGQYQKNCEINAGHLSFGLGQSPQSFLMFALISILLRLFRYKLLLEDVIKNTPDSHPDKKCLIEALEQIEHVAWHINEQLREHENSMKMVKMI